MIIKRHNEKHRTDRVGWLRAAVMGANDGILSTASLVVGVAASDAGRSAVLVAGIAGMVAGAMSMAAGEYVSVSSQADTEGADLARERKELAEDPEGELKELAAIYESRGVQPQLAKQVARELMAHDALAAHARDELGITGAFTARPVQAAVSSAVTFAIGAAMPLLVVAFSQERAMLSFVFGSTLVCLAGLGSLAAYTGGAPILKAAFRVTFWGALAMALTALVGKLFNVNV